ncbi:hypothetical protein F4810DRAFT_715993 [Camillea tinctor]|nr:hypothetical protein F4810DRAFT_715993 [Camillea tinctor]
MFSSKILLLALPLMDLTHAWEVTDYSGVDKCIAQSNTEYRIYDGSDSGVCHNFNGGDSGSKCSQYTNGGSNGPDACGSGYLLAQSARPRGCTVYTGKNCAGLWYTGDCVTPGFGLTLASFKCNPREQSWVN